MNERFTPRHDDLHQKPTPTPLGPLVMQGLLEQQQRQPATKTGHETREEPMFNHQYADPRVYGTDREFAFGD